MIVYPPAPWKLKGLILQSIRLIPLEKARSFTPPHLDIVPVLPNRTLGLVTIARYGAGSALEYNELIVSPALTRYQRRFGFWISHIYVDNEHSRAGGREIWGLPKEIAQFYWSQDQHQVEVQQGTQRLCSLRMKTSTWHIPFAMALPAFSIRATDLLTFRASLIGRVGVAAGTLEISPESPFAALNFSSKGLAFSVPHMQLVVGPPRAIAQVPEQMPVDY